MTILVTVCDEPVVPRFSFVRGYDFSVGSIITYDCEDMWIKLGRSSNTQIKMNNTTDTCKAKLNMSQKAEDSFSEIVWGREQAEVWTDIKLREPEESKFLLMTRKTATQ